jgi:pimeloyl-ACP methyl ester carboxylesterase
VHEDEHIVYGGQPHRIRDEARGRVAPPPHIALDTAAVRQASSQRTTASSPSAPLEASLEASLEAPLDRLPADAQAIWRWAEARPALAMAWGAEMDWSPEELAAFHAERLAHGRATLGDLPLVVLARTHGGYDAGMRISADSLERERLALQRDLAALSRRGRLVIAPDAGHNIHVEDPGLVVQAITGVVRQARRGH